MGRKEEADIIIFEHHDRNREPSQPVKKSLMPSC